MSKEYKEQFTRKELQMANTHERSFHVTINWELHVKSTMRYSLITTSLAFMYTRMHKSIRTHTYI